MWALVPDHYLEKADRFHLVPDRAGGHVARENTPEGDVRQIAGVLHHAVHRPRDAGLVVRVPRREVDRGQAQLLAQCPPPRQERHHPVSYTHLRAHET